MFTIVQISLVATIFQSFLYGIYIATTIKCFRWLIFTDEGWKPREKVNPLSIAFATIFIFLMSTINLIALLKFTLQALGRDEMMYSGRINVTFQAISEVLALISIDGTLIYRCWIVYAKSWRVICIPATFWFPSLACSALFTYYGEPNFFPAKFGQIEGNALIGLYVCNIAISIYTTTAIIYRIRYTMKTSGSNSKQLNYIMRILAESGILYTSMTVFCLVGTVLITLNNPTWVEKLIMNISDPINFSMGGISFNLILIRVHQSRIELWDSLADEGEQTLSGMQFNNHRIGASTEGAPSNTQAADEVMNEIQKHRRSHDGMHMN